MNVESISEKRASLMRIELWAVITFFVFIIFAFITEAAEPMEKRPNEVAFEKAGYAFDYYRNYFSPLLIRSVFLFGCFVVLNFVAIPNILTRQHVTLNALLVVTLFALTVVMYVVTDTYTKAYLFKDFLSVNDAYFSFYIKRTAHVGWLFVAVVIYTGIKNTGQYLVIHADAIERKTKFFRKESVYAFAIWMMTFFIVLIMDEGSEFVIVWALLLPSAILFYSFAFHTLIPWALGKKRSFFNYVLAAAFICLVAFFVVTLLILLFQGDDDLAFAFGTFNAAFQFLITAPLSWVLFKRYSRGNEEVYTLKKQLGQTHANFDFLRSQINPHFLFNALNTIYGTAIQEKAERTSEAVEKLGSMMRFMLQENMQEKISLAREVEYLIDYIELQKLRTDHLSSVAIQTDIQSPLPPVQISPMLLIPFVENAFKHGISLREPSHIKVILEVKENVLYFDVYNSRHVKTENDPEKDKSGIGLVNVKQRLQLFYPSRHELVIRETGKEFFIHLTIRL